MKVNFTFASCAAHSGVQPQQASTSTHLVTPLDHIGAVKLTVIWALPAHLASVQTHMKFVRKQSALQAHSSASADLLPAAASRHSRGKDPAEKAHHIWH